MSEILIYVWSTAYAAERTRAASMKNSVEDCAKLADQAVDEAVKRFPYLRPSPSERLGLGDGR